MTDMIVMVPLLEFTPTILKNTKADSQKSTYFLSANLIFFVSSTCLIKQLLSSSLYSKVERYSFSQIWNWKIFGFILLILVQMSLPKFEQNNRFQSIFENILLQFSNGIFVYNRLE